MIRGKKGDSLQIVETVDFTKIIRNNVVSWKVLVKRGPRRQNDKQKRIGEKQED